jgi:hypothetical protein
MDNNTAPNIKIQKCNSISVVLRDLLIKTKKQTPLIMEIGFENYFYFKYKALILSGKNNLLPNSMLTGFKIDGNDLIFYPLLVTNNHVYLGYDQWLNEIVIDDKDIEYNLVSRREIILAIADKEAAHTDRDYDKKFYKIGMLNKLNIEYKINGVTKKAVNNIYYEAIITIANELVEAFNLFKKINNKIKSVFISKGYYIAEKISLSDKLDGYRFNEWPSGEDKTGLSTLSTLNFESKHAVTDVSFGKLKLHLFRDASEKYEIPFVDFNNYNNVGVVINNKNPFCLVGLEFNRKKIILISGSNVSSKSTLASGNYLFPNKSGIIKKNVECNIDNVFELIGIPPLDIT